MRRHFLMFGLLWAVLGVSQLTGMAAAAEQNSGTTAAEAQDEQAIRQAGAAYREAFAKGDIDTVAGFWTPNADFVDQTGRAYKVQAALAHAQQLAQEGAQIPQPLRKTATLAIRFVTPDVALEDGTFERTGAAAQTSPQGRYTAVWVKRDGKWLLDGERESPVRVDATTDPLESLAWMVGEWTATGEQIKAEFLCTWGPGKHYLLRQITSQPAGEQPISATQWIGWDPTQQRVRSFLFDSRGGFTEGVWTNEGDAWVARSQGVLRDGRRRSATTLYSRVDDNSWSVETLDDEIDGQPGPEISLRVTRKAAAK